MHKAVGDGEGEGQGEGERERERILGVKGNQYVTMKTANKKR
jgi:hypothetical protein